MQIKHEIKKASVIKTLDLLENKTGRGSFSFAEIQESFPDATEGIHADYFELVDAIIRCEEAVLIECTYDGKQKYWKQIRV